MDFILLIVRAAQHLDIDKLLTLDLASFLYTYISLLLISTTLWSQSHLLWITEDKKKYLVSDIATT